MEDLKITKPTIIKLIYQLVYDTKQILELNKIKFWGIGGTALGAIRHHGIIPWDDDADIGILSNDKNRFLQLTSTFEKLGYKIIKVWFGYKIFYANRKLVLDTEYSFPNLDVFLYKYDKKSDRYIQYFKDARDTWPNEYYLKHQIDKLDKHQFGSYTIPIPSDVTIYFVRMYGADWNKVAYRQYDHAREDIVEKVKVKLTSKDRVPAEPTDKIVDRRRLTNLCTIKQYHKSPSYYIHRSYKSVPPCTGNFKYKISTYLINCPSHTERLKRFTQYAKNANLDFCIEKCVAGSEFTPALLCEMVKKKYIDNKAQLTPTELAICLSHFNIWSKIAKGKNDYGLIFEDDCHFTSDLVPKINKYMDDILSKGVKFDTFYLYNGNWGKESVDEGLEHLVGDVYREVEDFNAGGVSYIISKAFCKKLLKIFFPISIPQDMFLGLTLGTHLTLKTKYSKKYDCYLSKVVWVDCGGEGGTGASTQTYGALTINKLSCKSC